VADPRRGVRAVSADDRGDAREHVHVDAQQPGAAAAGRHGGDAGAFSSGFGLVFHPARASRAVSTSRRLIDARAFRLTDEPYVFHPQTLPWQGHLARGGLQVLLLSIMWGLAHPLS